MVRARGQLERREGVVNVLVESVEPLERDEGRKQRQPPAEQAPTRPGPSPAPSSRRARELAVAELRAVAPAGHSFGRRGH
jgi:hypothetical protein